MSKEIEAGVSPPPTPADGLGRRLRDAHLGSLLAGVSLLFGVLKVLIVAHFNTTTALGIVAESATASLVLGVLIRALPAVLLAILVVLLAVVDDDATPPADLRFYRRATVIVCVLAALTQAPYMALMLAFVAWTMLAGPGSARFYGWARPEDRHHRDRVAAAKRASDEIQAEVAAIPELVAEAEAAADAVEAAVLDPGTPEEMEVLLDRRRQALVRLGELVEVHEKAEAVGAEWDAIAAASKVHVFRVEAARPRTKKALTIGAVFFGVQALVLMLDTRPWLAAERLHLDGQAPVTGYVIKADADELVVLDEESRQLVRLDGAKVTSRRYCEVGSPERGFFTPTLALLVDPEPYPRCDRLGP